MIQMLNTRDAIELAQLLSPHIPETFEDDNVLSFVGTIVSNIKDSDTPEVFADTLRLMYNVTNEELVEVPGLELAEMFGSGLVENQIISLCEFYQWLMK
jgi:hypothetical protein